MSEEQKPITMQPDMDLADQLRKDFTSKHCVEEVFRAAADMAASVGVTVTWEITSVEAMDVNQERMSGALGRLATAGGAMLCGGKINPIQVLDAQDPMRLIRERKKGCK
jgi:hypothetical protein